MVQILVEMTSNSPFFRKKQPGTQFDIRAIESSWAKLNSMVPLRPIHDEAGYDQMIAFMNSLLDVVGDNEDHALSGLLELVGDLVSTYEREHYVFADGE